MMINVDVKELHCVALMLLVVHLVGYLDEAGRMRYLFYIGILSILALRAILSL